MAPLAVFSPATGTRVKLEAIAMLVWGL